MAFRWNSGILFARLHVALLAGVFLALPPKVIAQSFTPYYYDIGSINVVDVFVDPSGGSDTRDGLSRARALRTVSEAWRRIPSSQQLSEGYRINLLPGTYGDHADELPNYWELKRGTRSAPIILQAADGQGTVSLTGDINMANVSYFYLINVSISRGGDVFHCEACDHILLRGNILIGAPLGRDVPPAARETIKVNQSQYIYIENNFIRGAGDNAIDFVAVQHGHIVGNKVSDAQSWCAYVKGGSSYLRIEGNEFYECFEGGVTAGQGTGFEFMVSPWIRYEAYDIKIVNNLIHDIFGAALGVNGGYNILLAHNTAYKVGARSHLVEVVFGERSCDGDSAACLARAAAGGWGPSASGTESQPIGNKQIKVYNNLIYNPPGHPINDQHFAIYGPRNATAGGIPSPQVTDEELEIKGNIIWNGPTDHSLGIEGGEQGCQPSNPSCNATQIRADNTINSLQPELRDPAQGDYRPAPGGNLVDISARSITQFPARGIQEPSDEGELSNLFLRDFSGADYSSLLVGAFASADSSTNPPGSDGDFGGGGNTPDDPGAPTISRIQLKVRRVGRAFEVTVRVRATDDGQIVRVTARAPGTKTATLKRRGGEYTGKLRIRRRSGVNVSVTVTDNNGNSTSSVSRT